jgi:mRNA-degrading endonuclease toxin of MazEF toxin-antitoxin module
LEVAGVVLCDQLKSLDWKARQARLIGALPGRLVKEIQGMILALIQ